MGDTSSPDTGGHTLGEDFAGQPCPVIVGPTAVGKTDLITRLAQQRPIEVISLDSRQVYRGLRIGTAQPTPEDLAVCPHHLIDFLSPAKKYDAIGFRQDFERTYREIRNRQASPVLVGGAGMYLTALREGFMHIPGSSPEKLAAIRTELDSLSDEEVRTGLKEVDPESAAGIHSNDRYRTQRALEIFRISGSTMSHLKSLQKPDPSLGLQFPTFVLERPVPQLDSRIASRTSQMLKAGWIEETEAVMAEFAADCPGLRSIGYREIVRCLVGSLARTELDSEIVLVTRQYAKRQRTWFRQVPGDRFHPENADDLLVGILNHIP